MPNLLTQDLNYVLEHAGAIWDQLRDQNIFITGGTGFVGTWLIESLLWANDVKSLGVRTTLLTRNPDAFRRKAPHLAEHRSVYLLRGDACSFDYPEGQFAFVIHAATDRSFDPTPGQPLSTLETDLGATKRVLEFARTHNTRRLLFTSSGAVYGKQPPHVTHISEDYAGAPATTDIRSAYGQGKRASEFMCAMYASQFGFAAVIARLFAFVGPYLPLDENFAVGNFLRDVLKQRPVRIAGDGTPYRSYLYAADLAIWLWTMLVRGETARPYNVGSAEDLTIADLAKLVVSSTDSEQPIEIARQPIPGALPARYVPSIIRAETELGLRPFIGVSEGIRRTYLWQMKAGALG